MDKEVDPAVLAVINEKRLTGEKRTPVDIIARLGVPDAFKKAYDYAWLAAGGTVIATVWAEFVSIGAAGHWFCVEPLDTRFRTGGVPRSAQQAQRAEDRLKLLKRSLDIGEGIRVVLQTNRVPIFDFETDKAAKVSMRVSDDTEWHVAAWDDAQNLAVLVRGPRGWLPGDDDMAAARARRGVPAAVQEGAVSREALQTAAIAFLARHFSGYGYRTESPADPKLGYDIEVQDKKGATLLKLAVKGTSPGATGFQLTADERACAKRGDPWRLAVVSEPLGPAPLHKLYKPAEIDSAPGIETPIPE